jgi:hypothetical protein
MNSVATRGHRDAILPATPSKRPSLSRGLGNVVDRALNPHPDLGLRDVLLPEFLRAEAASAAERYDQLAQPVDRPRMMAWLAGVNGGMGHPLKDQEFADRATDIAQALGDLPADVFTSGTRTDAQKAFKFFPGVAELNEFLRPLAVPIVRHRDVLHRLLDAREAEQTERAALTDEQREQIVSDFQRKMAELRLELPSERETGKPPATATPLSHAQLVAVYRNQLANARTDLDRNAALTRLQMLEPQEATCST